MRRVIIFSFVAVFIALGCGEEEGPTESDIPRLEREIQQKDRLIGTLQKEIQQKDSSISSLEQQIFEYEHEIFEYEHATQTSTVVKGSIVIFGGQYADYPFSVSQNMKNVRLKGDFNSVSGGNLYVVVFDDLSFRNWKAGGEAKAWYSSGKAVVGTIDLPLTVPDTYHLVFSNTHSWITKKTVSVSIGLEFEL